MGTRESNWYADLMSMADCLASDAKVEEAGGGDEQGYLGVMTSLVGGKRATSQQRTTGKMYRRGYQSDRDTRCRAVGNGCQSMDFAPRHKTGTAQTSDESGVVVWRFC